MRCSGWELALKDTIVHESTQRRYSPLVTVWTAVVQTCLQACRWRFLFIESSIVNNTNPPMRTFHFKSIASESFMCCCMEKYYLHTWYRKFSFHCRVLHSWSMFVFVWEDELQSGRLQFRVHYERSLVSISLRITLLNFSRSDMVGLKCWVECRVQPGKWVTIKSTFSVVVSCKR